MSDKVIDANRLYIQTRNANQTLNGGTGLTTLSSVEPIADTLEMACQFWLNSVTYSDGVARNCDYTVNGAAQPSMKAMIQWVDSWNASFGGRDYPAFNDPRLTVGMMALAHGENYQADQSYMLYYGALGGGDEGVLYTKSSAWKNGGGMNSVMYKIHFISLPSTGTLPVPVTVSTANVDLLHHMLKGDITGAVDPTFAALENN
jgi:hypothetical protein